MSTRFMAFNSSGKSLYSLVSQPVLEDSLNKVRGVMSAEFPWIRIADQDEGVGFSVRGGGLGSVFDRISLSDSGLPIDRDWRRLESLSAQLGDRVTVGLVLAQVLDETIRCTDWSIVGWLPASAVVYRVLKVVHSLDGVAAHRLGTYLQAAPIFEDFLDWVVGYVTEQLEQVQMMCASFQYVEECLGGSLLNLEPEVSRLRYEDRLSSNRLFFEVVHRLVLPFVFDDQVDEFLEEIDEWCPWRPGDEVVPHRTQQRWIRFWAVVASHLPVTWSDGQRRTLRSLRDEGVDVP